MSKGDLSGVTTFVAAAKAHSFTEAGEAIGVSKSAVGKAIARLEARLGVKLFHRTTRRLTLTTDGEAYLAACTAALEEITAAEAALGTGSCAPSGRLRVDMPAAFGRQVMLPILLRIAAQHPDLQLSLTFTDYLIDPVEEGVDLAIRFGEPKDSTGLVARRLTCERWVIAGAPAYLAHHGTPQTLDDLDTHQAIVGWRPGQPLSWRVTCDGAAQRFVPSATHQISDGEAIITAALAGLGLCQQPASLLAPHIASGQLVTVLDNVTTERVPVYAVWPKTAHLRPKVRYVVDTLIRLAQEGELPSADLRNLCDYG